MSDKDARQQLVDFLNKPHGTRDVVLPIDHCSRRNVPALQRLRYNVIHHEFDGPHTVPPELAQNAVAWFLSQPRRR